MIKNMIRKEILLLLREKGTFFWLIILPILFILIFASILGNQVDTIKVRYYDADQSKSSQELVTGLKELKGFDVVMDDKVPLEEQIEKIKSGKTTSLLVIPKGYEQTLKAAQKPAELEFYRDVTADTAVAPIKSVLQNVSYNYREVKLQGELKKTGKSDSEVTAAMASPFTIREMKEDVKKVDIISQVVPGYTVMFVFFILITMVRRLIKDKESGMLSRLRSTTMKPVQYLIGMWVPNMLVVIVQCAVLLLFGKFVYGMNIGNPIAMALIVLCLSFCATGIGLALSMIAKSENQGMGFTQIITMGGAILGGLWFPIDFMPSFAQIIGKFTPQYWAQQAFQDVIIRGSNMGGVWVNLVILVGIGILGLLIATARFKKFVTSATS
ncbi:ABC transporter permease [Paenibacillus sp. KN14-4R]|uniref:ABC transporter permease n=1 Tax=Paenibacillus sp. KN14-4R TaxID=3445773 RepID=UPI003FA0979A